jgi:hypothetical protein
MRPCTFPPTQAVTRLFDLLPLFHLAPFAPCMAAMCGSKPNTVTLNRYPLDMVTLLNRMVT